MSDPARGDSTDPTRLSLLLLADDCNPEWPSLPIVGYKYALALSRIADVTVATHVRNRPNIENAAPKGVGFVYLDNEYVAAPLYRLATRLRGGNEVAWSTNMIMQYLPHLAFEREAFRHFRGDLKTGRFDLVHRITPMTPTLPSYIAGKLDVPFVIGPLNGNLPWPKEFRAEQSRERERLRGLRNLARHMPFSRGTWKRASLVLAGFEHTLSELRDRANGKLVNFPEIGYDPEVFHAGRVTPAFSGEGPFRFLFAGRLVPYKLPEVAIRAFIGPLADAGHSLDIVGDGPEMARLRDIVATESLDEAVTFHGRLPQDAVAAVMRQSDGFIFPSIRELGAGVVIEAMASGATCFVTDYGAPGHLAQNGRGYTVPLDTVDNLVSAYRETLLKAVADPTAAAQASRDAIEYAEGLYTWDTKAAATMTYYQDVLDGRPVEDRHTYD